MASKRDPERFKDVLLEHIHRDIKGLQSKQCDDIQMEGKVTLSNGHVQALCEHLDLILMHGLRSTEYGYWPLVSYFTRSEAIKTIQQLPAIRTAVGKGRAWLYLALNEQLLESYFRMFMENQDIVKTYYLREAFLKDLEKLLVVQTLVAGLDYIEFDLPNDSIYLDYGATKASSTVGTLQSNITPDVEPTFVSSIIPRSKLTHESTVEIKQELSSNNRSSAVFGKVTSSSVDSDSRVRTIKEHTSLSPAGQEVKGGVTGDVIRDRRDDLQDSQSPHRTLSQETNQYNQPLRSTESSCNSSHLSSMQPHSPESHRSDGGVLEDSDLVIHEPKKAGGKKRKKKRKQEKDDSVRTHPSVQVVNVPTRPNVLNQPELGGINVPNQPASSSLSVPFQPTVNVDQIQADTSTNIDRSDDITCPTLSRVETNSAPHQVFGEDNPENQQASNDSSFSWNQDLTDGGPTSLVGEEELGNSCIESVEEYGIHPKPVLQIGKRVSLADELELAMTKVLPPEPDEEREHDSPLPHQKVTSLDIAESHSSTNQDTPTSHDVTTPPLDSSSSSTREDVTCSQKEEKAQTLLETTPDPLLYNGSPKRPDNISEEDKMANDVEISDNTRLVISLDVLHQEDEELIRLVQVATPTVLGQQRNCYVLITSQSVYILRKDGIEGHYSREIAIKYRDFDHIVIGLGWQSLLLVYRRTSSYEFPEDSDNQYVILTGSEAVSRSIVDSIRTKAAVCPDFMSSIPLNKDDETRINAIEKELIKLGSETSMDIEQYLLVNWEQLSEEAPPVACEDVGVNRSGYLLLKTTNLIGIPTWRPAYFTIRNGCLYQYSSEDDDIAKNSYQIRNCGGCTRALGENKPFSFSILGADQSVTVVLAANNEEDLTQWMQSLCEAVIEREMPGSPSHRKTCFFCALLLTQNKLHILQEDWNNQSVQLVASCAVKDVNDVCVDRSLPLYCTISYDHGHDQGLWLVCFNTEYELGKFETALASMWRELFEINLQFSEVSDVLTRQRAHKAVELMQGSKFRSDSMTKGRTEFTYNS